MNSEALRDSGIYPGDVLIVDRSLPAVHGKVIVAVVNGEMLVRRLLVHRQGRTLAADNKNIPAISIVPGTDYMAWGVVVYTIHTV
jgi:DNA polymerase V